MVEESGQGKQSPHQDLVALHAAPALEGVCVEGADGAVEEVQHVLLPREVLEAVGGPLDLLHVVPVHVGLHGVQQLPASLVQEEATHHTEDSQGARLDALALQRLPFPEELALQRMTRGVPALRASRQATSRRAEGL